MSNLLGRSGAGSGRPLPPLPQPEVMASLELSRGDSLYRRGDADDQVWRVQAGLLKLFVDTAAGRERILGLAGPGDLIGTLAGGSFTARENAVALSSSVRIDLLAPSLSAELRMAALSRQLEQLSEAFETNELPVPARLARTLLHLSDRFGQEQSGGTVRLTLPLTHDNLAAMIGAARETTSFTLSELRRAGLVQGTRGNYLVNPVGLHEYAARNSLI